jgi:hypothetical protein
MTNDIRTRHAELALALASDDQRLLDALTQRPHLLNPYPSIVTRMSRRSRRFRHKLALDRELRTALPGRRPAPVQV